MTGLVDRPNLIHRNDGIMAYIGARWVSDEEVRAPIRPDLFNNGGLLSGVVSYALIDYGMAAALWPHVDWEEEAFATISIGITYIATAREGEVVCRTRLDRRTRATAALRSEVADDTGRLLTTAVGTYAIFPRQR